MTSAQGCVKARLSSRGGAGGTNGGGGEIAKFHRGTLGSSRGSHRGKGGVRVSRFGLEGDREVEPLTASAGAEANYCCASPDGI